MDKEIIKQIVEEGLAGTDNYLIEVVVKPGNLILVEIDSDQALGIDDCVVLSKFIESRLDREVEDYELEVGSAGITSPFKVLRQYQKNIGNEIEVLTKDGKKLTGVLKAADEAAFTLIITKQEKPEGAKRKVMVEEDLRYTYEEIKYAKYVIRFK
ncbi:ribosome maturation factor RimP [Parabacteroides sp. PFB2-10]|uniref:ribosome assembly cofactor RimP n=1 Tax=Parabacteroides sp. PFB2-10 TaxID=1742405 RepID=UPI002474583B|nr:ribosome assembly cofactor RimP [Parabacteroides sp. PFB2-10]MDH6311493.1 ribosome maturation factor RimP [Parabacteroides sp. PFB2-10]